MIIKIGTCGWSAKGGRKNYFKYFNTIELQNTFYKLPKVKTALKIRKEAPKDFEINAKVWQVITHPSSSPTWKKAKLKIDRKILKHYGFFRPTEENFKAWEKTLEICNALKCRICIFQTPSSFKPNDENINNILSFFPSIKRNGLIMGWEPRGKWNKELELVKQICKKLDLIHVVDIFKREPVYTPGIAYFRLHGIGKEINYRYKYTDSDLNRLLKNVLKFSKDNVVYVYFNNIFMFEDALRFKRLLEGGNIIGNA